jgi:hypothetical protein
VKILLNGTTVIGATKHITGGALQTQKQIATSPWALKVGDFIECVVAQDSGGNLNVDASGDYSPEFGMVWLAPL